MPCRHWWKRASCKRSRKNCFSVSAIGVSSKTELWNTWNLKAVRTSCSLQASIALGIGLRSATGLKDLTVHVEYPDPNSMDSSQSFDPFQANCMDSQAYAEIENTWSGRLSTHFHPEPVSFEPIAASYNYMWYMTNVTNVQIEIRHVHTQWLFCKNSAMCSSHALFMRILDTQLKLKDWETIICARYTIMSASRLCQTAWTCPETDYPRQTVMARGEEWLSKNDPSDASSSCQGCVLNCQCKLHDLCDNLINIIT